MNLRALALVLLLVTCTPASALEMYFVNDNPDYNNNDVYITFEGTGSGAGVFQGSINSGPDSGAIPTVSGTIGLGGLSGTAVVYDTSAVTISQSYSLAQLVGGVNVTVGPSARFYVTLGAPLKTGISGGGVAPGDGNGVLNYGLPSVTSGSSDPNFNINWADQEFAVGTTAAYGDISTISAYNFPVTMQNFTSANATGTALQTVTTQPLNSSVLSQLEALANANQANALNATAYNTLIGNGSAANAATWTTTVNGTGEFLRQVSSANAPTPTGTITIGPYPSFQKYIDTVATDDVTTVISGTLGLTGTSGSYNLTSSGTYIGGAQHASIYFTGTSSLVPNATFTMVVAPDTGVGTASANYNASNFIYGAAVSGPTTLTLTETLSGTTTTFANLADFQTAFGAGNNGNGTTLFQKAIHDLTAGYNFGLIGNTLSPTGTTTTYNDMGSAGWTQIASLYITQTGTNAGMQLPAEYKNMLFSNPLGTSSDEFYNMWAAILYNASPSDYGFAYSDYLQSVALYTEQFDDQPVGSWLVTIDPVPEPGAWPLLACITALFFGRFFLSRRRPVLVVKR